MFCIFFDISSSGIARNSTTLKSKASKIYQVNECIFNKASNNLSSKFTVLESKAYIVKINPYNSYIGENYGNQSCCS